MPSSTESKRACVLGMIAFWVVGCGVQGQVLPAEGRDRQAATATPDLSDETPGQEGAAPGSPSAGGGDSGGSGSGDFSGSGSFVDGDVPVDPDTAGQGPSDAGSGAGFDAGAATGGEPAYDAGSAEEQSLARGAGLFPALCAGCHGQRGERIGVRVTSDFEQLASLIDATMPKGSPDSCSRGCAEDLARYILATF